MHAGGLRCAVGMGALFRGLHHDLRLALRVFCRCALLVDGINGHCVALLAVMMLTLCVPQSQVLVCDDEFDCRIHMVSRAAIRWGT